MKIDPRFIADSGREVFTGNELLVKGALEASGGVHLLTGYPGSPIAGFFDCLQSLAPLLNDKGMVAKLANNEALSMAMVNGSQMAGCRAITAFKSVGLHVASDALALGVLAGTQQGGGGLVVCGDDPWSDSTQVPADSRYLAEHVRLPMVEPSSPQEVKDWIDLSFKLGDAGRIFIGYSITTALADGGGTVSLKPNHYPTLNENHKTALQYERDIEPHLDSTVLLPPRTWQRELGLERRFDAIKRAARELGINQLLHAPQKGERVPMGFIAAGNAYSYLAHALSEMGLTGRLPILKLGMVYPLDEAIVTELAERCDQLIVVEERRGFVERQVVEALQGKRQSGDLDVEVYGKAFPRGLEGIPATRGLNPSVLIERLVPLIRDHATLPIELTNGRLSAELACIKQTEQVEISLPSRTPSFCPGCPHRDSSSVLLELREDLRDPQYMLEKHKRKPVDLVAHGDTGCYTMLMFEPNKPLMQNYSGMGLGGATGLGIDPFIENKQLVFLGDGTFYHSGMTAVSQSIYNGQDIAYIVLDNKTTAMTGHQVNAGDEVDLRGNVAFGQDIERIVKSMIPAKLKKDVRIVRIDPSDRDRYRQLLEQTILADGVKIIIADKECGITFHRRAKREERKVREANGFTPRKTYMNVATEVCENCRECTTQTGCPGLTVVGSDYGPKVQTDMSWCVDDGACERVHACPSFEQVTVVRSQSPRMGDEQVDLSRLPEPPAPIHGEQDIWRCYLAGVGGMGIGICTSILVSAGNAMGYHVQFLDKKGLAIRNGGVFSQVVFSQNPDASSVGVNGSYTTPQIPYGKADLLLGVDILEACRAIDPSHPYRVVGKDRTATVVNCAKTPTIKSLMDLEDFDPDSLERALEDASKPDQFFSFNVGDLCERVLDSKLYANIMLLGMAYQRGYIPLTREVIEGAIRKILRQDTERNLRAFNIGRRIVVEPQKFVVDPPHTRENAPLTFRRKYHTIQRMFPGRKGKLLAKRYRVLMKQTVRVTTGQQMPDDLVRDVVVRGFDCLVWGGIEYAQQYCDLVVATFKKDSPVNDWAVTRAVVWNLAKVMLIKDEIYVSQLLTSPEKYRRDMRRFNVHPSHGDKIIYRHYNRPEFNLFGRTIRFEWKSRDWQLRLMAKARFLRKWLPKWHQRERGFRDWYIDLVKQWDPHHPATRGADTDRAEAEYRRWHAVLATVEPVTGYREVRYPKMDAAKRRAQFLMGQPPEAFATPGVIDAPVQVEREGEAVRLPVVVGR